MFRAKPSAGTEKLIGIGLPLSTKPPSRRFHNVLLLLLYLAFFVLIVNKILHTICLLRPSVDESISKEEGVKSNEEGTEKSATAKTTEDVPLSKEEITLDTKDANRL